jgi:hypothetical protein
MLKSLMLAAALTLGTLSMAQAADAPKPMKEHNGPCAEVFQACKNAGFTRGDMKNGKGLMANCIKPLDEGKTVAGVSLDKAKIEACKTHHAAKKAEFEQKMKNDPEFAKKVEARKIKWEKRHDAMKAKIDATVPTAPATH